MDTSDVFDISLNGSPIPYEEHYTPPIRPLTALETAIIATSTPSCPPQSGWRTHEVLPGDTLASLALSLGIDVGILREGNCLTVSDPNLLPGMTLNIPVVVPSPTEIIPTSLPQPTRVLSTRPVVRCVPPPSWISYSVKAGDTLFGLSKAVGASVSAIQTANCMGSSTLIRTGESILLPRYPVFTAFPTATRWQTPIPSATPRPPMFTPVTPPTATNTPPPAPPSPVATEPPPIPNATDTEPPPPPPPPPLPQSSPETELPPSPIENVETEIP
jgi:LysM repeat protein